MSPVVMQTISSNCKGYIIASDLRVALDIMEDSRDRYSAWLQDWETTRKAGVAAATMRPVSSAGTCGPTQGASTDTCDRPAAAASVETDARKACFCDGLDAEGKGCSLHSSALGPALTEMADGRIHISMLPLPSHEAADVAASNTVHSNSSSSSNPMMVVGSQSPIRQRAYVGSPVQPSSPWVLPVVEGSLGGKYDCRDPTLGATEQQHGSRPAAAAAPSAESCSSALVDNSQEAKESNQSSDMARSQQFQGQQPMVYEQAQGQLQHLMTETNTELAAPAPLLQQAGSYRPAAGSSSCNAGTGLASSASTISLPGLIASSSSQRLLPRLQLPKALIAMSRGTLMQPSVSAGDGETAANKAAAVLSGDACAGAGASRRTTDWPVGREAPMSLGAAPKKRQRSSIQYQPRTIASKGLYGEYQLPSKVHMWPCV